MFFIPALAALLVSTSVAPLLASPHPVSATLVVQQLRTCRDARLAIGIPLEAPAGVLSDIVRIEVVSSLRVGRPLGLVYSLANGREFFALAAGVLDDRATLEATNEFLEHGTLEPARGGVDRSMEGFAVSPVIVDRHRLATLGFESDNCAGIRVF